MTDSDTSKSPTVAYAPFKTFLSAVEALSHGVPDNINRSVWPSFSGVMISQVLGAFRFLGLISMDGTPTPALHSLVENDKDRKSTLKGILIRAYPDLVKRDLSKMSMDTLHRAMREYQVTGETLKKAITFFLQAARYAELPLSQYILQQTRSASGPRKKRMSALKGENGREELDSIVTLAEGPTKTVSLQRGVTLSLQLSADVFKMAPDDRNFVLRLIEEIEKYETEHPRVSEET